MNKLLSRSIMLIIAVVIGFPVFADGETDIRYTEDGFKIINNEQWIKIGGVLMWDTDAASGAFWDFEEDNDNWHTRSELRRARLNIKTKLSDYWKAKIQFDYDNNEGSVGIKDANVEYCKWKTVNIIVGQDKEPFGLENLSSSKNLGFVERSLASNAFSPGRSIGIALKGHRKCFNWQTGVYQAETREDEGDTYAVTGRLTFVPWKTDSAYFHLGVSGSYRDFDGEKFEINEPAQIHTADIIVFSDEIAADHLLLYGIESVFSHGPFSLAAEYIAGDVNAVEDNDDATLSGYYLTAGWFVTGEKRPLKNGLWKGVKPESSYGAWELAARYCSLDAGENNSGTDAETCTLGVNWYINSHVTLMTDYTYLWLTDKETSGETTADAVSMRLQCRF